MRVKVTRSITYMEASKMDEQNPEVTFTKIVQSAVAKPKLKTFSTQILDKDKVITSSTKVLTSTPKKANKNQTPSQPLTQKPKSTKSLQNDIRIAENQSNPAHEVIFQPKYIDLYESEPNFIKSFGVRILPVLESANIIL